jgi:hypothetical protein
MKRLLLSSVLLLILSLFLESCNSSLSITKRRYHKGYYVHHNTGRSDVASKTTGNSRLSKQKHSSPEAARSQQSSEQTASVEPAGDLPVLTAEAPARVSDKDEYMSARPSSTLPIELAIKNPVKTIKALTDQIAAHPEAEDALSLLWILLLILAIVYVAGLLLNNFGLGSLIHVLLVIILVLLILWLLRIL